MPENAIGFEDIIRVINKFEKILKSNKKAK